MSTRYVSCSCNCITDCADWGRNGLICFGTCNAIAIYDPCNQTGQIIHTLHKHTDQVTKVHWIKPRNTTQESELLSGSADGTVIIWSKINHSYQCTSVLNINEKVIAADSLQLTDNISLNKQVFAELLICTGSIKNGLKIWLRKKNADTKVIQTIVFGRKLLMCCRLAYLPNTKHPLLAIALHDASISLYANRSDTIDSNFINVQNLSGHEEWIQCMDFTHNSHGSIFLATGSNDTTIRLWKISETTTEPLNDQFKQITKIFEANDKEYSVTLESVLSGHEDYVYGVHWQPIKQEDGNSCQPMRLLSSSFDKSMNIWELDDATGIWIEKIRVGKVGGDFLGFRGGKFSPDGLHIMGYGYSFQIWKYSQTIANWTPQYAPSGHFNEVIDLCWESKGRFLITASKDETTRIHAPCKDGLKELWHEIARPQIHGYEMTCLAMLAPHMYASGADENVVRIFTTTSAFKNRLGFLTNVNDVKCAAADGATVPSLGLTNKATFNEEISKDNVKNTNVNDTYEPPTEEELAQNTLWPELQKLYGHGYEIFCMAARHDGRLLATACKSTDLERSAIILWNTDTWSETQKLISHELTVTQMQFSPNDKYLMSVSRDRRWSLFQDDGESYILVRSSSKKRGLHSRIIWCCAWTYDSNYFATGSRDGKIGIWSTQLKEDDTQNVLPETVLDIRNQSVTALCFDQSCIIQGHYILAIGYQTGCIEIYKLIFGEGNVTWTKFMEFDTSQAHHLTVKRLMFRPNNEHSPNILQLASCSSDGAVKIQDIDYRDLQDID